MNRRMLGKVSASPCGCCDPLAGSGKGKTGMRRLNRRREREYWRNPRTEI